MKEILFCCKAVPTGLANHHCFWHLSLAHHCLR